MEDTSGVCHNTRTLEPLPRAQEVLQQVSENFMTGFLRDLPQDLTGLLPVFVSHGVADEDSLRSMLRMANWRFWIYSWVKEGALTELQFQMLLEGIARLS